jgi:hypothetical protein
MTTIEEGDTIRLVTTHPAMDDKLKDKKGETGVVIDDDWGWNGKLHIEFDDAFKSRYGVDRTRVELVEGETDNEIKQLEEQ